MNVTNPYGFIYITTNTVNGKRYIGQKRFDNKYQWKFYLGSGKALKMAVNKYGKDNFHRDIVDIAYSRDELDSKEIQWVTNYNAVESEDFYNIADGGHAGNKYAGKTEEEMDEIRKKISEAGKGRILSDNARQNISSAKKGESNPMWGKYNEKNPFYGKHHSIETRTKLSEMRKGTHQTEERRRKVSKPVVQLSKEGNFIAGYYSAKEASRETGTDTSDIAKCCKGKQNTARGYTWVYAEEYYRRCG